MSVDSSWGLKAGCGGGRERAGPPRPPPPKLEARGTLKENIDATNKRGSAGDLGPADLVASAEPDWPALSAWQGSFGLTLRTWCLLHRHRSGGGGRGQPRQPRIRVLHTSHVCQRQAPLGLSSFSSKMGVTLAASSWQFWWGCRTQSAEVVLTLSGSSVNANSCNFRGFCFFFFYQHASVSSLHSGLRPGGEVGTLAALPPRLLQGFPLPGGQSPKALCWRCPPDPQPVWRGPACPSRVRSQGPSALSGPGTPGSLLRPKAPPQTAVSNSKMARNAKEKSHIKIQLLKYFLEASV